MLGTAINQKHVVDSHYNLLTEVFLMSTHNMFYGELTKNYSLNIIKYTLQEMCCGFLLSREMWYRKSVLPGTGAG